MNKSTLKTENSNQNNCYNTAVYLYKRTVFTMANATTNIHKDISCSQHNALKKTKINHTKTQEKSTMKQFTNDYQVKQYTHKIFSQLSLFTLMLCLYGCSNQKEILTGHREYIDISQHNNNINKTNEAVTLGSVESLNQCTQSFYNKENICGLLSYSCSFTKFQNTNLSDSINKLTYNMPAPIIINDIVYCMDQDGRINAIKNGKIIWNLNVSVQNASGHTGAALIYKDGKLYCSTSFAECMCICPQTQTILWRRKLPAVCKGDGLAVDGQILYVLNFNNTLLALDCATGNTIWKHEGISNNIGFAGSSKIAIDNDNVYVGYISGDVYAINKKTGSVIWSAFLSKYSLDTVLSQIAHPRACPVVIGNMVIFTAQNGLISAFDKTNGKVIWEQNIGGINTFSYSGNSLFIVDNSDTAYCISLKNGKMKWNYILPVKKHSQFYATALTNNGFIAISLYGDVFVLNTRTGAIELQKSLKTQLISHASITNEKLYLLSKDGLKVFK